MSQLIKEIDKDFPNGFNIIHEISGFRNSGIYKKREISLVALVVIRNDADCCVDFWVVYEQKLIYIEIETPSPGLVRWISWQPYNSVLQSSYKTLYENIPERDISDPIKNKTILDLLKTL